MNLKKFGKCFGSNSKLSLSKLSSIFLNSIPFLLIKLSAFYCFVNEIISMKGYKIQQKKFLKISPYLFITFKHIIHIEVHKKRQHYLTVVYILST